MSMISQMPIKKRWAWLMSVMLMGFLARADGHEDTGLLSIVEPLVVKEDVLSGSVINITEERAKRGDAGKLSSLTSEDKMALLTMLDMPEEDTRTTPGNDEFLEPRSFPYAIDSPPSIVNVSSMLSYCVYEESHSFEMCEKLWANTCDKDTLTHFRLNNMNAATVCTNEDRVYVAFAGTQSLNDVIVDASILSQVMNYTKGKLFAHGGFVERSKVYSAWVVKTLAGIQGIKEKEIILTGHSLGAAQATLLTHDVYEGLGLDARGGGVSNSLNQVKVIAYASPSVMLDPSSYFLGHLNHLRFYNEHDPVATRLSTASGYKHVGVEFVPSDGPTGNISRAVPLLKKQHSLKLVHDLPYSHWKSLPPRTRSRFDLGLDAHTMDSQTMAAAPTLKEYQEGRDDSHRSVIAIVNVEKVLSKRVSAPVTCKLQYGKVICISSSKVIAKFRYALDALPTGQEVDACMSSIVSANFIPGLTVNAGISFEKKMTPESVASEALVLDISTEDKWYERMPSRMLADVYLDGRTLFPDICERTPTLLTPEKSLPVERALIRKYINSAPRLFSVTENHVLPPNDIVKLIQDDDVFFGDKQAEAWMDCRLPENNIFCPALCTEDEQACAVMKKWGTDSLGTDYWVSLNKDSNVRWGDDSNSWKYTITERSNTWFPFWNSPSQATFVVVRNDLEDYLQFSN